MDGVLLLLFIGWGFYVVVVYTGEINTRLFSLPFFFFYPSVFLKCSRYLIALELNKLLNP